MRRVALSYARECPTPTQGRRVCQYAGRTTTLSARTMPRKTSPHHNATRRWATLAAVAAGALLLLVGGAGLVITRRRRATA